jgi:hypothetical protein
MARQSLSLVGGWVASLRMLADLGRWQDAFA